MNLDRDSELIENSFDGIRKRHAYIRNHMKNNTGQIRGMKEASRSKFIRLKGLSKFGVRVVGAGSWRVTYAFFRNSRRSR